MNTVCAPFAEALRQGRDDFNQRFLLARRSVPELDAGTFSQFLLAAAAPLIAAVAERQPAAVFDTVSAAYDIALELACHGLISPRYTAIGELWANHLPSAAHLIASAPNRVLGATTNALHHLITTSDAHPGEWSNRIARIAPHCADAETFLRAGQVAAWRSGLAHYRAAALELSATLYPDVAAAIFDLAGPSDWTTAKGQLAEDRWIDPAQSSPQTGLRIARKAGAFRGFGGFFPEPPLVAESHGQLLVRSGNDCWLLTADCFGATFHRANLADYPQETRSALPEGARLVNDCIQRGSESLSLAEFGHVTSRALTSDTFAVTCAFTHAILLIALR